MIKTREEIEALAELKHPNRFKEDIHYDFNEETRLGFIEGYTLAQEEIITELNRRVAIILSEPDGVVRETMINNL